MDGKNGKRWNPYWCTQYNTKKGSSHVVTIYNVSRLFSHLPSFVSLQSHHTRSYLEDLFSFSKLFFIMQPFRFFSSLLPNLSLLCPSIFTLPNNLQSWGAPVAFFHLDLIQLTQRFLGKLVKIPLSRGNLFLWFFKTIKLTVRSFIWCCFGYTPIYLKLEKKLGNMENSQV